MPSYRERSYRKRVSAGELFSFRVIVKETDLWVSASNPVEKETRDLVLDGRYQIETYIMNNPEFKDSLVPFGSDPYAPPIIRKMIEATAKMGVGPMASVAGAIAEYVGEGLLEHTDQVIVENGGDIYIKANRPVTVSILAGQSPLSGKIGLCLKEEQMPMAICSSSGSVGHSMSMGKVDVVSLLSRSAVFADSAATAVGNRVKSKTYIQESAEWASEIEGIEGGVIIVGDRMATWGDVRVVEL